MTGPDFGGLLAKHRAIEHQEVKAHSVHCKRTVKLSALNLYASFPRGYAPGPHVRVTSFLHLQDVSYRFLKIPGSKSKVDNLDYFFSLATDSHIIKIFDADHYTDQYGPRFAVERFILDKNADVVQGRCIIFKSKASWLSSLIAVEIDKIYAVSHPGRAIFFGFALFTGSDSYWRHTSFARSQDG